MDTDRMLKEIQEETKKVYQKKYGGRNPATLSRHELEAVSHEASIRVQERRKGRLVE
ncbi:hypothetical protein LCGC14_0393230 [marine sediment metagenome]|uniref:Uncharacterized protein n=1 Tax=marine sediment metagenome TaxID=412755 RepID=A0A0F9TH41_9ZZZZ